MKISRGKLPLSVTAIVISAIAFAGVVFIEDLRALTRTSIPKFKACSKQDTITTSKEKAQFTTEEEIVDEDKIPFDPDECRVTDGRWVFNSSSEPLYSDRTCPYLDEQVACIRNGRPDTYYKNWEWELDECILPRFNATKVLEKLRGKRLMFVGDSLQRGQWQSFICMIESHIPAGQKSMNQSHSLSVFRAEEYNASIEFYWAPFLVESNSDSPIITDRSKRILRIDSVAKHGKHWIGVDFLVFNTYVWWMSNQRIKSLWGSFSNGEEGYEVLDAVTAYRIGLKTWANWVDSTINSSVTKVFFTTLSPTHMRNSDWHNKNGTKCYNETIPGLKTEYRKSGSDLKMVNVVASIVRKMKVPVTFINITQLSERDIDGRTSVQTEAGGKMLSDEQKANLKWYVDCIHWCLPGLPDTWNQILYAYL